MAHAPLITFKAGKCELEGKRVTADPQPGFLYVFLEDELPHLCWRPRSAPSSEPEIDLIIPPGDVTFEPLPREEGAEDLHSPTNGRIYVLQFKSSGERRFFYLQSKSQHRNGDPSWFSERDQRLGQIVNSILQGDDDLDMENELSALRQSGPGDDDMEIDSAEGHTGGAGADATGGDTRREGNAGRDGGADGGRAQPPTQPQTNALVQDFLRSLQGDAASSQQQQAQPRNQQYTTLADLLPASTTIPFLQRATPTQIDELCAYLPADLFLLALETNTEPSSLSSQASTDASATIAALSTQQKRDILARVLRSPQLQQSLGSLTIALRDGGLPVIGEALGINVEHGGLIRGGSMPLGGGEAVQGFVEGVRRTVEQEQKAADAGSRQQEDEAMTDE